MERGKLMLSELWDWVKTIAISFVIVFLVQAFLFSPAIVSGRSMEPTLSDRQWLFSNKIVYLIGKPKFGDVVVLNNPNRAVEKDNKYFVKRIVGVGGDHIEIRDGELYRNGEMLEEEYTDSVIEGRDVVNVTVPDGQYFVMGDNRKLMMSNDSRSFGPIDEDEIIGRIDGVIWPLTEFKWF